MANGNMTVASVAQHDYVASPTGEHNDVALTSCHSAGMMIH